MKINISEIKNKKNAVLGVSGSLKLKFENEDFKFIKPLEVNLTITNTGESLLVEGKIKTKIIAICSRCLESFEYSVETELEEEFYSHIDENLSLILKENCQEGNLYYDNFLDVDEIIRENIILQLPIKFLCREDCLGLCPRCGKNLNYGKCECEKEIDPRWEVLKNFKI